MKIEEEEVEDLQKFVHLGAKVTNTAGTTEDIKSTVNKARMTYDRFRKVWGTANMPVKTKLKHSKHW